MCSPYFAKCFNSKFQTNTANSSTEAASIKSKEPIEDEFAEARRYSEATMESLYALLGKTIEENLKKLAERRAKQDKGTKIESVEGKLVKAISVVNIRDTAFSNNCRLSTDMLKDVHEVEENSMGIENRQLSSDEIFEIGANVSAGKDNGATTAISTDGSMEVLKEDAEQAVTALTSNSINKSLTHLPSDALIKTENEESCNEIENRLLSAFDKVFEISAISAAPTTISSDASQQDLKEEVEQNITALTNNTMAERSRAKSLTNIKHDTSIEKAAWKNASKKKHLKSNSSCKILAKHSGQSNSNNKYSEAIASMGDCSDLDKVQQHLPSICNTKGGGDTQPNRIGTALIKKKPMGTLSTFAKASSKFPALASKTTKATKTLQDVKTKNDKNTVLQLNLKAAVIQEQHLLAENTMEEDQMDEVELVEMSETEAAATSECRAAICLGDFIEIGLKKHQKHAVSEMRGRQKKANNVNDARASGNSRKISKAKTAKYQSMSSILKTKKLPKLPLQSPATTLKAISMPQKTAAITTNTSKIASSAGKLIHELAQSQATVAALPLATATTTALAKSDINATVCQFPTQINAIAAVLWPSMPIANAFNMPLASEHSNTMNNSVDTAVRCNSSRLNENKLFIGGLAQKTTIEKVRNYFSLWGTVLEAVLICHPNSRKSRGFAFVTYAASESVERVLQLPEHILDNKRIDPQHVCLSERLLNKHSCKTFVGGISQLTNGEHVKEYFEKYGPIERVSMMLDTETQRHRGCCFVVFKQPETCELVCAVRHHWIQNKRVECKRALYHARKLMANINGPGLLGDHPLDLYQRLYPCTEILQGALAAQNVQNQFISMLRCSALPMWREMPSQQFYEGCNLVQLPADNLAVKDVVQPAKSNEKEK